MRIKINEYQKKLIPNTVFSYGGRYDSDLTSAAERCGYTDFRHYIDAEFIIRYCPNCGTELYGLWHSLNYVEYQDDKYKSYGDSLNSSAKMARSNALHEKVELEELEICPACGKQLQAMASYKDGHPAVTGLYYNGFSLKTSIETTGPRLLTYLKNENPLNWGQLYGLNYRGTIRKNYRFDLYYFAELTDAEIAKREEQFLDSASKLMQEKRYLTYEEKSKKDVEDFAKNIKILSANVMDSPIDNDLITKTPNELKKYILNLITLESDIYSLNQRLENLYFRKICNDEKYNSKFYNHIYEQEKDIKERLDIAKMQYDNLMFEMNSLKRKKSCINYPKKPNKPKLKTLDECIKNVDYPKKPNEPSLQKPGLFNKAKVNAANEALLKQYELDCNSYEKAKSNYEIKLLENNQKLMEDYKEELEKYESRCVECKEKEKEFEQEKEIKIKKGEEQLQEAKAYIDAINFELEAFKAKKEDSYSLFPEFICAELGIKKIIDKEIEDAEQLLKKLIETRSSMYNLNVVFGKYRDIVALSTFYEYLVSGRCEKLEGSDGAYNLYESECRANMIISQLSKVIELLEEIRNTQYMICDLLESIRNSLSTMNSTMNMALNSIQTIESNSTEANAYLEHISNNSDVIAYNTAATAYYSKLNAELTNSLGYLIALK